MSSTKTDILIISDIHMGTPVSRSKVLREFLEASTFRKLILNGDIFDDLDFTRLSKDDWALFDYLRKLTARKNETEVVWIAGNHDVSAFTLSRIIGIRVRAEYMFEWNGKRCLAIHGHQFDRFLYANPITSLLASWVYLFIQLIDSRQQRFSRWVKKMSKSWLRLAKEVAKGSSLYAKFLKRADYVFCGHTHREDHTDEYGSEYWNSGCWTDIPSTYITLDEHGVSSHHVN